MIRKAIVEDAYKLAVMQIDNFKDSYKRVISETDLEKLDYLDEQKEQELNILNNEIYVYVDEKTQAVIATIWFDCIKDIIKLLNISVEKPYRRQGVATFLFEFLKQEAYSRQADFIQINVLADDLAIVTFLQDIGAVITSDSRDIINGHDVKKLEFKFEL